MSSRSNTPNTFRRSGIPRFLAEPSKSRKKLFTVIAALMAVPLALVVLLTVKSAVHISFVKLATLEEQQRGIEILDRNNRKLIVVRQSDTEPVSLSAISKNFRNAVIATEDKNFYFHHGIDVLGVVRAFLANAQAGKIVEGGSTISQQLAKVNFLHRQDRSYSRKFKEALVALDLETCYSKDHILETYLNNVYFGRGAYGIERASQTYFGKSASKLNLAESSFLAGLIQAPSTYGSKKNYAAAKRRQQVVLQAMAESGYITTAQSKATGAAKLTMKTEPYSIKYPYYVSHVLSKVKATIGEDKMWQTPLRIQTSIDPKAQAAAEQQLNRGLKKAPAGLNQGALVTISVKDGSVLAMVGGVGPFRSSQWNRAVYPHTAGSTMKPFVYLAGLIQDELGPDTVLNDAPFVVPNRDGSVYSPKNYDNQFKGLITVRDALALSRNVCAVAVANNVGMEHVIETAKEAGIKSKLEPYLSTALGACAVTPLELANSYATLARDGVYMEPTFVRAITTSDGTVLNKFETKGERRLPAEPVKQIVDVMQDVVERGTGKRARIGQLAIAGKTGTADNATDVWFVGFTPEVVTAVWAGNDKNDPVKQRGITGGTIAAGIWHDYMSSYIKTHPPTVLAFNPPDEPFDTALHQTPPLIAHVDDALYEIGEGFNEGFNEGYTGGTNDAVKVKREEPRAVAHHEQTKEKKPKRSIVRRLFHKLAHLF